MINNEYLVELAKRFCLPSANLQAQSYGNGHINDTFVLTAEGTGKRYILQRINDYVFKKPEEVMENIQGITTWLKDRIIQEGGNPERETLMLVPAKDGRTFIRDEQGVWRVFPFVEGTMSRDLPDSEELFEETGRGFGCFQRRLDGYPAGTLHETIVDFHNTPVRYQQFIEAMRKNTSGRLSGIKDEIAFCEARKDECGTLLRAHEEGFIPLRVTHNDTKINNLLLDTATKRAVCVIDLDTVMPGLAAYDFGDAIRTGASSAAEDERNLNKVSLSLPMFKAFTRGYLSEAGRTMSRDEVRMLPLGAKLMTFENGLRFLADYLNGDVYFRVHREGQNLDRARAQFALVRDMEEKMNEMTEIALSFID